MMCNSVSLSVATWKLVTEKPLSSEPQENDGADEELEEPEPLELWELEPLELEPLEELEELPLETVPEIHFWVCSYGQYVQVKEGMHYLRHACQGWNRSHCRK